LEQECWVALAESARSWSAAKHSSFRTADLRAVTARLRRVLFGIREVKAIATEPVEAMEQRVEQLKTDTRIRPAKSGDNVALDELDRASSGDKVTFLGDRSGWANGERAELEREVHQEYRCQKDGPCAHVHCYGCGLLLGPKHQYQGWPDEATGAVLCRFVALRDPDTGAFLRWMEAITSCWGRRDRLSPSYHPTPNQGPCCKHCGKEMERETADQLCGWKCRKSWRYAHDMKYQAEQLEKRRLRKRSRNRLANCVWPRS
jgi:hypothetical protein